MKIIFVLATLLTLNSIANAAVLDCNVKQTNTKFTNTVEGAYVANTEGVDLTLTPLEKDGKTFVSLDATFQNSNVEITTLYIDPSISNGLVAVITTLGGKSLTIGCK